MIRPIDLQTTIISAQSSPSVQRLEEAPRMTAQAEQAAFAAQSTRRDETVAPTAEVLHNKVGDEPKGNGRERHDRDHPPRNKFEQLVDDAAASSEEAPHLVDYTA
jgi:hypothetical protein